jgi:hypothetical protein
VDGGHLHKGFGLRKSFHASRFALQAACAVNTLGSVVGRSSQSWGKSKKFR